MLWDKSDVKGLKDDGEVCSHAKNKPTLACHYLAVLCSCIYTWMRSSERYNRCGQDGEANLLGKGQRKKK